MVLTKHSVTTGLSFGSTSGIITTLGLMVGLHSGTHDSTVVLGGILSIAVADAFSDALGIHISEEAEHVHTAKEIWEATIAAFVCKFLFALTFVVPVLLFDLSTAIVVSVVWGLSAVAVLSYLIARSEEDSPWKPIVEHVIITAVVIATTHQVGDWINANLS